MKYSDLKNKQAKELNEFPMFFAFSQKQFDEGMIKLGVTNIDELISINGTGGYIKKVDESKLDELFKRHQTELTNAYEDDVFLIEAYRYELANHEYGYTGDPSDAINAIGLNTDNKHVFDCLQIAKQKAMKEFEECN